MSGRNLFAIRNDRHLLEKAARERPCVFVSHSSADKAAARKLADWLMEQGVNVYFDEHDQVLRAAAASGEDKAIVQCIHDGLDKSTHAICVISKNTTNSQWVPYEMGYSASRNHPLALVQLAEVKELPSFYKVASVIKDLADLIQYVNKILAGYDLLYEYVKKAYLPGRTSLEGVLLSVRPTTRG